MNYGKLFAWLMVAMNIIAPGYGIQHDWRKALH